MPVRRQRVPPAAVSRRSRLAVLNVSSPAAFLPSMPPDAESSLDAVAQDTAIAELTHEEAVAVVAGVVRRLFAFAPERQARDVAAAVLRDLRRSGIRLMRCGDDLPPEA
jgi:hypothetical protein